MEKRYLLAVGNSLELEQLLKGVCSEQSIDVVSVASIADAKRMLIKQIPVLIFCSIEVGDDDQAGVSFCQQLQDHPQLGAVPVILFSSKINQDVVRQAAQSGARGFLTIPTTIDMLRHRLGAFLSSSEQKAPSLKIETKQPAPQQPPPSSQSIVPNTITPPPPPKPPVSQPSPVASAPMEQDEEFKLKLAAAEKILLKVLNNLRTSQLLQVVELEDIPKVVLEITRSVCGAKTDKK